MKVAAFTSLTTAYLPNGRILAKSTKEFHPEWDFFLLFNDRTPTQIKWHEEPFDEVVFAEWLDVKKNWYDFAYFYSVIEFCTATKGAMAQYLFNLGYDAVVYLDPDICLFSPLLEVIDLLGNCEANVILTPHITDIENTVEAIESHEIAALKHGTFNLGFFAVANRGSGQEYIRWWTDRLINYSHIDFNSGLFTDQKWCNIAPYIFENVHVLRDRSYNVATWNMTNRSLSRRESGEWLVNEKPLRFYHFSGFGHDFAWANRELELFGQSGQPLQELWNIYKDLYRQNSLTFKAPAWHWGVDRHRRTIDSHLRLRANQSAWLNPYEMT